MTYPIIEVVTSSRQIAGKAYLVVHAVNRGDLAAEVSYESPYGTKTLLLDPLEENVSVFATRAENYPAGNLNVQIEYNQKYTGGGPLPF